MEENKKKKRVPLITKDTYKNCASWFPIAMLIVVILAAIQTLYHCRACYMAYGTSLAVAEAFMYCGTIWEIVSAIVTLSWWLFIVVIFIIGRFIGEPVSAEPVRVKKASIDSPSTEVETKDNKPEDIKLEDKSEIAMLNKKIEQENRGD